MSVMKATLSSLNLHRIPRRVFVWSGPCNKWLFKDTPSYWAKQSNTTPIWSFFRRWYTPVWGTWFKFPLIIQHLYVTSAISLYVYMYVYTPFQSGCASFLSVTSFENYLIFFTTFWHHMFKIKGTLIDCDGHKSKWMLLWLSPVHINGGFSKTLTQTKFIYTVSDLSTSKHRKSGDWCKKSGDFRKNL